MTRGTVTEKVDPLPGVLSTAMRPPSSSASFFDSGRPRPVPFTRPCSAVRDLAELLEDDLDVAWVDADAGVAHVRS